MAKKVVLIYHLEDKKRVAGMKKTLLLLGVRGKFIPKEEYTRPIGELFGKLEKTEIIPYEGEELPTEMIVMDGFNRPQMDYFFQELRKNGVGTIDIKAVLTPTNGQWNGIDLYEELVKEHKIMHYEFQEEKSNGES